MRNTVAAVILALGTTVIPLSGWAADPAPFTFKSVSVDLPSSDRLFPPGPNAETVNDNCITCHSVGMVLNQPRLPKATWEAEVHKMIDVYKAPVQASDIPLIVAYLDSIKGTEPAAAPPAK
jgi:hypothetical protein